MVALGSPDLASDPAGSSWLVRESAGKAATTRFWELLLDSKTYAR